MWRKPVLESVLSVYMTASLGNAGLGDAGSGFEWAMRLPVKGSCLAGLRMRSCPEVRQVREEDVL